MDGLAACLTCLHQDGAATRRQDMQLVMTTVVTPTMGYGSNPQLRERGVIYQGSCTIYTNTIYTSTNISFVNNIICFVAMQKNFLYDFAEPGIPAASSWWTLWW